MITFRVTITVSIAKRDLVQVACQTFNTVMKILVYLESEQGRIMWQHNVTTFPAVTTFPVKSSDIPGNLRNVFIKNKVKSKKSGHLLFFRESELFTSHLPCFRQTSQVSFRNCHNPDFSGFILLPVAPLVFHVKEETAWNTSAKTGTYGNPKQIGRMRSSTWFY